MKHRCCKLFARTTLMAALLSLPLLLAAQYGPPEEVQKAQALMQAKDYDGAIKILEDFLNRNPARPGAWNMLGTSYTRKGDYDKALEAYRQAMQTPQFRPQSMYNSACVYALKDNKEEAFKLLRQ